MGESKDDSDEEPAKSHRMQASIAKKVIDNRLNMTAWEHIPYVFFQIFKNWKLN